ncbi:hypothetical protein R6Q59_009944 [Mikania micrantha]
MSIVDDQIRRFDTYLDRCQLLYAQSQKPNISDEGIVEPTAASIHDTARASALKNVIRALSITSTSNPLLKRRRLRYLIADIKRPHGKVQVEASNDEEDLEWFATGKATVQLYGVLLKSLLSQTIPLSESLWYWDDVLGSYVRTSLYMLQTSPIRLLNAGKEVWGEASTRYRSKMSPRDAAEQSTETLSQGWKEFYQLVREIVRDRSLSQARSRILSPFAMNRTEARQKQEQLKKLREQSATAIGLLVDEGLSFPPESDFYTWRTTVIKSVSLLEGLLNHAKSIGGTVGDYEYNVIETMDAAEENNDQPHQLATRLLHILDKHLPEQETSSFEMAAKFGKPPRWVRYWIPGVILLLSGSTLLRIFANRQADIEQWIRDLGQTTIDFWQNWVLEPAKRLLGTIRHDETTELAIMSKHSLRSDQESLQRMVVDFAIEHPEGGTPYTEAQIIDIKAKVKEGDLTPVLRAYEQEMKSPIVRAITGSLIRALLIQIQKTKVDVEVAMGGIDNILKSQELLFGFVGLAPGLLLSYFVAQWARGFLGGRRGLEELQRKGESVRLLRNIDRILTHSTPTQEGMLSYKDHGLLICEVHLLRQKAASVLPGRIQREFLEDMGDLMTVRDGIEKQKRALQRVQWAYATWLK